MLPHVLLLSAVVVWGWTFVATKILLAELGPIEIVAMRLAIGQRDRQTRLRRRIEFADNSSTGQSKHDTPAAHGCHAEIHEKSSRTIGELQN